MCVCVCVVDVCACKCVRARGERRVWISGMTRERAYISPAKFDASFGAPAYNTVQLQRCTLNQNAPLRKFMFCSCQ